MIYTNIKRLGLGFLLVLLFPLLGKSQGMLDPTKWTMSLSKHEVKANETLEIIFTVTINDGWHLYSLGDEPPQANFTIEGSGFELVGKMKESAEVHEKYDENLEMKVKYFDKKAEFRQTIKILKKNPVINIEVEGQACPNGPGQCVRVNKSFTINKIKVTASVEKTDSDNSNSKNTEKTNSSTASNNVASKDRLNQLEAEKKKLIVKDSKGNDESISYLKNFANKYGSTK